MPHNIYVTNSAQVSADKVWETAANNFGNTYICHPSVENSELLTGTDLPFGVGTMRQCTMYDKSTIVETVTGVNHTEKQFVLLMSEYAMPVKDFGASVKVFATGANSCEITVGMTFTVEGGPFGWLMGALMMKPMMKGVLRDMLTCLAYYSKTGKPVGKGMPSNAELAPLGVKQVKAKKKL